MIQTGLQFIAAEFLICLGVSVLYKRYGNMRFFKIMPQVIMVLIVNVLCDTIGIWSHTNNPVISTTISGTMGYLVPFMVYIVCIQADFKRMMKIGPKMLAVMVMTTVSIMVGFAVSAVVLQNQLGIDQLAETYGAWCGAFNGGIENLYAVAEGTGLSEQNMANALVLINLVYSPWVMLMVALPAFAPKFNKWTNANLAQIEEIAEKVGEEDESLPFNQFNLFRLIAVGVITIAIGATLSQPLYDMCSFVPKAVWQYVIITIISAILGTYTDIGRTTGVTEMGGMLATFVIGISVANIDLKMFTNIGYFFVAGVIVLVVHAIVMIIVAKVMKVDLCTLGCASIANVGAVSSATVVSAAYSRAHQPIAVLMAALGSVYGTFSGLAMVAILNAIL